MDETTTNMRDGWEDHFTKATDHMAQAVDELTAAGRHLEPNFRSRVLAVRKNLESLAGRAISSQGKITRDRARLAEAAVAQDT